MRTALEEIGLHTYHPARAWDNAEETFGLWNKALQAKYYGRGKSWERQDFDQLLGEYQVGYMIAHSPPGPRGDFIHF